MESRKRIDIFTEETLRRQWFEFNAFQPCENVRVRKRAASDHDSRNAGIRHRTQRFAINDTSVTGHRYL